MQKHSREHDLSRVLNFWTEERSLTVMLILLLLHFFVLSPGRFLGHAFQMVAALFLSLALLAGILALQRPVRPPARHRPGRRDDNVSGCLDLRRRPLAARLRHDLHPALPYGALILIVFRVVSEEGPVSGHRVRGAIALYLLMAMLFAFLYGLTEELSPGAFNIPGNWTDGMARGETFYYFSIVTLTTVGFGDITPLSTLLSAPSSCSRR